MTTNDKQIEEQGQFVGEPIAVYGNAAVRKTVSGRATLEVEAAIPVEEFRRRCHDKLRKMYWQV